MELIIYDFLTHHMLALSKDERDRIYGEVLTSTRMMVQDLETAIQDNDRQRALEAMIDLAVHQTQLLTNLKLKPEDDVYMDEAAGEKMKRHLFDFFRN